MSQSQLPTHKWKPSIKHRVLSNMSNEVVTPKQLAPKLGETQASISTAMFQLYEKGILGREPCPCGRGFVYWK